MATATATPVTLRPGPTAAAPQPSRRGRDGRAATAFTAPSIVGLALFTAFPIGMSVVISLFDWPTFGDRTFVGLGNYVRLLADPIFRQVLVNTLVFVVLYLPINIVVSLGLALWLASGIRGRHFFRVLFFIPVITPMVANVLVWRLIYQPGGLIDASLSSATGLHAPNFLGNPHWAMLAVVFMSVWQGFGYNMLVFSAALDNIPREINEAAQIDGTGPVSRLFRVTLPMLSPAMFFATTMTLITSLQVFTQPFLLTGGGPGASTETLVMFVYNQGFSNFALGVASAGAWMLFVIVLAITGLQFLGQRKWVNYDV
jgi:multiple sugar transport system permease protein